MKNKHIEFVGGSLCGRVLEMHERTKSIYDEKFGWYVMKDDGRLWHNDKMTQDSIKRNAQFRGEDEH